MDPTNLVETMKWQRKYNHANDQQKWWDENAQKIYNLVMQHSTTKMKTKLLTMDSWANTSTTQDGISLLKTIQDISHKKDGGANATTILDLVCMDKDMFLVHQAPTELLSSYLSKFKGAVDVIESSNGSSWSHPAATKIVFDISNDPTDLESAKAINSSKHQLVATEVQRHYLAALFFHGLSNKAHKDLKKKIHNDAFTGSDTISRTYNKVLQLADQYKSSYQQYNWDNNNLKDDKGLVKSDIAHPDLPDEFPGIDLKSEQPHHHQAVEVIEESDDEQLYAAQRNASLDDLPQQN